VGGSVDLSALGGADGVPDIEAVVAVGEQVYIALERLDMNYKPEGPGLIAIF